MLADAVMWRITVIGEAATRISLEGRATVGLPWPDIMGMDAGTMFVLLQGRPLGAGGCTHYARCRT